MRTSASRWLGAGLLGGVLLASTAAAAPDPAPAVAGAGAESAAHALYLAQRHAYAGQMKLAGELMRQADGARPACPVMVSVAVQGGVVPLCALDALRVPATVAGRIVSLRRRAALAPADQAARLLDEALKLDPFDGRTVGQLATVLRQQGHDARADTLVAAHAERTRIRLLWAGK
jgi:hypothetical protein